MLSDAFLGVLRACRGSTRPDAPSGSGQPEWRHLPPGGGWSPDSSGKQRSRARRFIEARVRVSFSEEVLRNTRVGEPAAMRVLGTTAAERGHREVSGVERHNSSSTSRSGEAPTPSRGGSRHVPDSTVPHGRARRRLAALRRPGDARRPRGGSLCSKRSTPVRRWAETSGASTGRPTVTASSR